jgi:hypothetical protein
MTVQQYLSILTPEQRALVERLSPERIAELALSCPATARERASARRAYDHEED